MKATKPVSKSGACLTPCISQRAFSSVHEAAGRCSKYSPRLGCRVALTLKAVYVLEKKSEGLKYDDGRRYHISIYLYAVVYAEDAASILFFFSGRIEKRRGYIQFSPRATKNS
jgi:hypothetical protein